MEPLGESLAGAAAEALLVAALLEVVAGRMVALEVVSMLELEEE